MPRIPPPRRRLAIIAATFVMAFRCAAQPGSPATVGDWPTAMLEARAATLVDVGATWSRLETQFPVELDWLLQDAGPDARRWFAAQRDTEIERAAIIRALAEMAAAKSEATGRLRSQFDQLVRDGARPTEASWLRLYMQTCSERRRIRLRPLVEQWPRIVFTKHHNMGGSHYAYTEAQSDAQAERTFIPGSSLCVLDLSAAVPTIHTLLDDPRGVIRDPDVSHDGRRILFAWKMDRDADDYHLYEIDTATGQVRQLTEGLGYADYEGQYLPSGDLVFSSTRCVQTTDCFTTEVSNLYTCDANGKYLRRLGFDQVSTNFPTVLNDGRIVYTRWEYNDRGQIFVQGLMQMNPDGTAQAGFYGMNSWFPTTILHARAIPGSHKLVAVASGHHTRQAGKLILIDNARGSEENAGVQLVAPVRPTEAVRVDAYGQQGELWQYPYPLSESQYLVTYTPHGWVKKSALFGIYWMDADGRRELLVSDPHVSCNQPVPLAARPAPEALPSHVNYRAQTASFYVQDVYAGQGLPGVARGTIKKLRVVALDYRLALIGSNNNGGPAGGAMVATPISTGNGAWDAKVVLGEATIRDDGSAYFEVPARTPVYFQAIDDKGHMVQSMRSWSTLQPGEVCSCVGCHEAKTCSPLPPKATYALSLAPEKLRPFYGPPRGFSFPKEVQPILDHHCIGCHDQPTGARPADGSKKAFSLLGTEIIDAHAKRKFSEAYLALTQSKRDAAGKGAFRGNPDNPWTNWIHAQSAPPVQPPYSAGSSRSGLIALLQAGHQGTTLSHEELDKIACWIDLCVPYCGDYMESNAWDERDWSHHNRLLQKRRSQEELEQKAIEDLLRAHQATGVQTRS